MTNTSRHAVTEFHLNDNVRLLRRHGDVCSGATGRILGTLPHHTELYIVSFNGETVRIAGDVLFEEIVLVDDRRASAA